MRMIGWGVLVCVLVSGCDGEPAPQDAGPPVDAGGYPTHVTWDLGPSTMNDDQPFHEFAPATCEWMPSTTTGESVLVSFDAIDGLAEISGVIALDADGHDVDSPNAYVDVRDVSANFYATLDGRGLCAYSAGSTLGDTVSTTAQINCDGNVDSPQASITVVLEQCPMAP